VDWLDFVAIGLYATLVLAIGIRTGRGHQTSGDLMLGGRSLPVWAVLCSMVATELSAATFIGVPQAAYSGDWSYLQLAFGALLGKLVVATCIIPLYHRMRIVTVYGFLEHRFGPHVRRAGALAFVVGRVLASGVRLFIAALAFAAVSGLDIVWAIVATGVLAGLYTGVGGIRAVVWTDTIQAAVFLLCAAVLIASIAAQSPGGLGEILQWAAREDRARIFHTEPLFAWNDSRLFGMALMGGFFLTLATHATDHDMVQRLLTTRDGRGGGIALAGSALLNFPITALFLAVGSGIAFSYVTPPAYDIADARSIVPIFALHELAPGLRGLIFAGLFAAAMSSLDSAICALSTTWSVDVARRTRSEGRLVRRSRWASFCFASALVGAALAMAAYHGALSASAAESGSQATAPGLVEFALSAMTILYGGLLGIFALGLLTQKRGSQASVLLGLGAGAATGLVLFLQPLWLGEPLLAWPAFVPLGAAVAFAVAGSQRARRLPGDPLCVSAEADVGAGRDVA